VHGGTGIVTVATLPASPSAGIAKGRVHGRGLIGKRARNVPVVVVRNRTIRGPSVVIAVTVTRSAAVKPLPTTTRGSVLASRSPGVGNAPAPGEAANVAATSAVVIVVASLRTPRP